MVNLQRQQYKNIMAATAAALASRTAMMRRAALLLGYAAAMVHATQYVTPKGITTSVKVVKVDGIKGHALAAFPSLAPHRSNTVRP